MSKLARYWPLIFLVLSVGISVALVVWRVGAGRITQHIAHPDYWWVILLVLGQFLAYLGYALAYKFIFELPVKQSLRHTFYGFSPMAALGGFTYDYRLVGRAGLRKVAALSVVEYAVLAPAVMAAAIYSLFVTSTVPESLSLPWALGVPVGILAALVIYVLRHNIHGKSAKTIDTVIHDLRGMGILPWLAIIFGTALYWVCELAILAAALKLFGTQLPIVALIIGYATGYVLTRRSLPTVLSGVSIVLMMIVLHWLGVPYAAAFLATYSYLVVNLIAPVIYLASEHFHTQAIPKA